MAFLFARSQWLGLRSKVAFFAGLVVVIRPAVNFRNFSGPVAVHMFHGCSPFQRGAVPWVLRSARAAVNAVKEIEEENKLSGSAKNGEHANHYIDVSKLVEHGEIGIFIIPARNTCQS